MTDVRASLDYTGSGEQIRLKASPVFSETDKIFFGLIFIHLIQKS